VTGGAVLGRRLPWFALGVICVLGVLAAVVLISRLAGRQRGPRSANLMVLFVVGGATLGLVQGLRFETQWRRGCGAEDDWAGEVFRLQGRLRYLWDRELWTVCVDRIGNDREARGYQPPIVLGISDRHGRMDRWAPTAWSGARIEGRGRWEGLEEADNPGERSGVASAKANGLSGWWDITGFSEPIRLEPAPMLGRILARARAQARKGLLAQVETAIESDRDADSAKVWLAILLGRRKGLSDLIREDFRRAGLMHLLVVSGLHVGLVAGICVAILRGCLRWPPAIVRPLSVLPVIGYVLVAGASPPAMRAGIMYCLWAAASLFRRRSNLSVTAFWTAATFALLWQRQGSQVGLQISFTVVVALMLWAPVLYTRLPRWGMPDVFKPRSLWGRWDLIRAGGSRWLRLSLSASLAAFFGLIPWSRALFGLVTPVSLLMNLAAIPTTSVILLAGGAAHLIKAACGSDLGFQWLFRLIRVLIGLADFGASLPGGAWAVPVAGWDIGSVTACMILLGATALLIGFRRQAIAAYLAATALGMAIVICSPAGRAPQAVLFHTGEGGGCAFFCAGRDILLVDSGSRYFGRRVLEGHHAAWPIGARLRAVLSKNRMDRAGGFFTLAEGGGQAFGLWLIDRSGRSDAAAGLAEKFPHIHAAVGANPPDWLAPFNVKSLQGEGLLIHHGGVTWWLTDRIPTRIPEGPPGRLVLYVVPQSASLGALQRIPEAPAGAICVLSSQRFGGYASESAMRWAFEQRGWKVLQTSSSGAVMLSGAGVLRTWRGDMVH
jgi:ComEC/Rec2-related protein